VIIACRNKSDFSFLFLILTSAVNVTLLAFAAECRAVASAAGSTAGGVRTVLSRKPTARRGCGRMMGQTDGRTHDHVISFAQYTMCI